MLKRKVPTIKWTAERSGSSPRVANDPLSSRTSSYADEERHCWVRCAVYCAETVYIYYIFCRAVSVPKNSYKFTSTFSMECNCSFKPLNWQRQRFQISIFSLPRLVQLQLPRISVTHKANQTEPDGEPSMRIPLRFDHIWSGRHS